jgi:hypothetical protein
MVLLELCSQNIFQQNLSCITCSTSDMKAPVCSRHDQTNKISMGSCVLNLNPATLCLSLLSHRPASSTLLKFWQKRNECSVDVPRDF